MVAAGWMNTDEECASLWCDGELQGPILSTGEGWMDALTYGGACYVAAVFDTQCKPVIILVFSILAFLFFSFFFDVVRWRQLAYDGCFVSVRGVCAAVCMLSEL